MSREVKEKSMNNIKIISIDIDGTLLNDQHEVTTTVKSTIQEALNQGIKIIITTGRPLSGVKPLLNELGIDGSDQYVITHNGGLMQTADGKKILFASALTLSEWTEINQFMHNHVVYLQAEDQDQAYTTTTLIDPWASYENYLVNLPLHVFKKDEDLKEINLIKAIANADSEELDRIQKIMPSTIEERVTVIRSTANNLEFVNKETSKGNALLALAKHLQVSVEQTMAIGDQANDSTMIQAAGLGVAMGNAIPEIKKLANVITEDNNHSGVAKAIQEYALN